MPLACMIVASTGLLLQPTLPMQRAAVVPTMALVDDFTVSRVVKDVRVFDDGASQAVVRWPE